jgi:hypothetical protein
MAEGVLKQMQVSQQIVETDAVADNGQRGHQRENQQPLWPDDGFFCMGVLLYSLDAVDIKVRATVSCSDDRHNGLPSLC